MSGRLYVVGTPIGNLGDLSPRGLAILETCDFIAAEDTRVTAKLLHHFAVKKPLVSYHEHNQRESGEKILTRLAQGEVCALVTDAGMPAISDPGENLVKLCRAAGVAVESVPGPVAFATALAVSGMSAGRFCFEGFLSTAKSARRDHLAQLVQEPRTMLFYEAPHKLAATLRDLYAALGDREIAIVRELTKIHEEVIRCTLSEAVERYATENPRGEIVLIVAGAAPKEETPATPEEAAEIARQFIRDGKSPAEAAKLAAKQTGLAKREIYSLLVE